MEVHLFLESVAHCVRPDHQVFLMGRKKNAHSAVVEVLNKPSLNRSLATSSSGNKHDTLLADSYVVERRLDPSALVFTKLKHVYLIQGPHVSIFSQ